MSEFLVELYKEGGCDYAELNLPASLDEIRRAFGEVGITNEQPDYKADLLYSSCEYLRRSMTDDVDIHELNQLADMLSGLDNWQRDCFEGLCIMEYRDTKYEPLSLERLINLALSTNECQVLYEAHDDKALGKFYAENDFIRELDNVPDKVMEWLDYGKIGAEMRQAEGGVFTQSGYVVLVGDISTEYASAKHPFQHSSADEQHEQEIGGMSLGQQL